MNRLRMAFGCLLFVLGARAQNGPPTGVVETVTIPPGGLAFVKVDLMPAPGTSNSFYNYVGSQLPSSSSMYYYDSHGGWMTYARGAKGWAAAISNRPMRLGESIFLKSGTAQVELVVQLQGVPPSNAVVDQTVYGAGLLTGLGYPYPVAVPWTNTDLAAKLVTGDNLYTWSTSNRWQMYRRTGKGWGAATNLILHPGEGTIVWKSSSNDVNWTESRPYTWP